MSSSPLVSTSTPTHQQYPYGFSTKTSDYTHISRPGLTQRTVQAISHFKQEPAWMAKFRLAAYRHYRSRPFPSWGPDLSAIDYQRIHYYLKPTDKLVSSWDQVPPDIKSTFDRLGVPQAERQVLAGVKAQFDSEVIYGSLKQTLNRLGVIFLSMDQAVQQYPDLVQSHLGTIVSPTDNKLAALNSAVWSGGSFLYVPPRVKVDLPLQAYFRLNTPRAGQFERTLIIADENSSVHYIEGCTAPAYSSESLHAAVVEIIVKPGARVQYTTVQNWYKTVNNLVTKRAWVDREGEMIWTDFNLGSKLTMKYPSFILAGRGARGETLSMALAGEGQHQDTGTKAIHLAPHTTSTIISKSISQLGGRTSYRGLVHVSPQAHHARSRVVCNALILDDRSRSDTYPTNRIQHHSAQLEHEASVSKISQDQLYYLMSRGLSEVEAGKLIVSGFVAPLVKKLPLEYAVEMNRLIDLEMENAIG